VVFVLDEQSYALHLPTVERVVRGVEVTRENHGLGSGGGKEGILDRVVCDKTPLSFLAQSLFKRPCMRPLGAYLPILRGLAGS
jgi:hypothetical protein